MKIDREHIVGVILGLIATAILYAILEYRPFSRANQAAEQKRSMPTTSEPYKANLDDVRFVELQISAVTTDMYQYLGWFPDEKEMLKKASAKAIDNLGTIKAYLRQLHFTWPLSELKVTNLAIADRLIQIYDGIESKEQDDIKESFAGFNGLYSQYSQKLKEVIRQNKPVEKLPEGFDSKSEEIKWAQNQEDGKLYFNAVKLIEERKFFEAYNDLTDLRVKYKDTVFETCIMLRLSYCLYRAESRDIGDNIFDPDKVIELLLRIIDNRQYSPVLFKAFYKWRTHTQSLWHGISNMSEIPNWEYNLKRWQAIQTIRQYLKTNPDDVWAKSQVNLLLGLPNIGRGGPFGNDNLSH